jgi:hypothetical protein
MKSDIVDIACVIRHETPRAWLIDAGGKEAVWIPKSQAEIDEDRGTIIAMPYWLAREKGLI